jgi:uncharacterized protein YidB (DUF937 family)
MDEIGKMLGGPSGGAGGGDIVGAIGGLVGGEGGLDGLISKLGQGGLGDVVGSWVGKGPNKPVAPDDLRAALGEEKVGQMAAQSGLSVESLMPMLAGALPAIVDTITPDGKVPSGDATAGIDLGGLLEGLSAAASAGPSSPLAALGGLLGSPKG